jgi:hypothetical protein
MRIIDCFIIILHYFTNIIITYDNIENNNINYIIIVLHNYTYILILINN